MTLSQKLEIIFGAGAVFASAYIVTLPPGPPPDSEGSMTVQGFLILVGPAIGVAAGSVLHVLSKSVFAYVLQFIGTLALLFFNGIIMAAGIYVSGWRASIFLMPCVFALLTLIMATRTRLAWARGSEAKDQRPTSA